MGYDLVSIDPDRHRVALKVRHASSGLKGTTVESEVWFHLGVNAVDPEQRVSVLSVDVHWLTGASVPAVAVDLARVLERIALGLREGPVGTLGLLTERGPPDGPVDPS